MPIAWGEPPSTVTVYPSGSRSEPVVLVDTVRVPGGATHLTENEVVAVPPEGTVTVWELPPLTVQFPATPESPTVWLPAARLGEVTLPFAPTARGAPPSTLTVCPLGSR